MNELKVIFRKTTDGEIIAFFPEINVNWNKIMSYMHVGQHGEADYGFYKKCTKTATEEEYKPLLNELKVIYNDYTLVVKQKLQYKDCFNSWK